MRTVLSALALVAVGATAAAQTPNPYPLGAPVPAPFANDSGQVVPFQPCTPFVTDAQGGLVYLPLCLQVLILMGDGEVYTMSWGQQDDTGQQVAPGVYTVDGVQYDLGADDAAVVPLGPPRLGLARSLYLAAPSQPGAVYLAAASLSSGFGIPLGCGQSFPLDFDAVALASLTMPSVFQSYVGVLDAFGTSQDPTLVLPNNPNLAGLTLDFAFLTADPNSPCGIGAVSAARSATILP